MNKERQELIRKQIDETFTAIIKLNDILKSADYKWADKNWEENDLASEIVNVGQNMIDWGKEFR